MPFYFAEGTSVLVDSVAANVKNVGGGVKLPSKKEEHESRMRSFSRNAQGHLFSHSIGTLNSLNYPPLSRKNCNSSSNSMSSLDAVSSTKALIR